MPSPRIPLSIAGLALVGACTTPDLGQSAAAIQPVVITVNDNGSFSPSSVQVNEGDTVVFQRPGGAALRTTDAIVRVPDGNLGTSCYTGGQPYDITHMLPGDDNELTGPLRRGTSGIYALGPEEHEGYVEGPTVGLTRSQLEALTVEDDPVELREGDAAVDAACDGYATSAGVALPVASVEEWHTVKRDGATTMLCRKHLLDGGDVTSTNSAFLLDSTWDNPDLAGAVVRINWEDMYSRSVRFNPTTWVYTPDWTILDHELDQAAKRGKLVLLEVMAGDGIPSWIFEASFHVPTDATATGIAPYTVTPVTTRDYGSNGSATMPRTDSCGYEKTMGSPADPDYRTAVTTMISNVAAHIRENGNHYQALGSFKVTGLNFLTGEMRLPRRCLDPLVDPDPNDNDPTPQIQCWCNSRIWAAPLGQDVLTYDDPDPYDAYVPKLVKGGGYTADAAADFMRLVENTLYTSLGKRKTMHYMLIQDGFPKVDDGDHYAVDAFEGQPGPWPSPWGALNYGYVYANGNPINFAAQTQAALDSGGDGEFKRITADGSPDPVGGDPDARALFAVMHAGLDSIPLEAAATAQGSAVGGAGVEVPDCANQANHPTPLTNGKYVAGLFDPSQPEPTGFGDENFYGQPGDGCPNKWAVREGYRNQVMGFQTTNDFTGPDDLSSALWNATLESNAVFLEAYERVLWQADQDRRGGATVLSTSSAGFAEIPERQKSLAQWAAELHARRRALATMAGNDLNRHMKDPFPVSYSFTFKKDLALNQLASYRFINPAARCAAGTLASGRIDVLGK